jgi:integrase
MFLTLAEAKRELAKVIAGRNPNGSMTLEQWHERYWPAIEASVRPATARCYDVGWRLRVKPSLGRHRLEDITSPMIESAMVTWPGGASAKNDALAVLSRLLDAARRSRFIDYNPAREVKRPSTRVRLAHLPRLTLEQVATLLALVPEGVYRRYLATLVYTGIRAGEATAAPGARRGLRAQHHPGQPVAEPRQERRAGGAEPEEPQVPRGAADRRAAPLCRGRARGKKPDDLLLSGPGGRLTNHNARRAVDWEVLRTAIGRPDLRMHDLRHTFATILFDAGASALTYRRPSRHSGLQVTER